MKGVCKRCKRTFDNMAAICPRCGADNAYTFGGLFVFYSILGFMLPVTWIMLPTIVLSAMAYRHA